MRRPRRVEAGDGHGGKTGNDRLEQHVLGGMPDLERRIKFASHLTPQDIHDRYRVLNGAIYVVGGIGARNTPVTEIYDPGPDAWR